MDGKGQRVFWTGSEKSEGQNESVFKRGDQGTWGETVSQGDQEQAEKPLGGGEDGGREVGGKASD